MASPALRVALVGALSLLGCTASPDEVGEDSLPQALLSRAQRRARAAGIRDTAARLGLTRAGWLLAGIADAETQLAHCWSELTWACQGPYSADCRGPVVAGAGDGPCGARQGGLGMFQFDGGTYEQTLRRDGQRVLTLAGNVEAAVDFVLRMVIDSAYVPNVATRGEAIAWLNGVTPDNDRFGPWVQTVTHYYNGCQPSFPCHPQRYRHYRDHARGVWSELGATFWNAPSPSPSPVAAAQAIAVDWSRLPDGSYEFRATPPAAVARVEYRVDGWLIGSVSRAERAGFAQRYTFQQATNERSLEVRGLDAAGAVVARGLGLLDVTPGFGVYLKQLDAARFEVGLERAPAGVAFVEVRADGYLLPDELTGLTQSPRGAVRYRFLQLGARDFELRTFNADGSLRGVLRRSFSLPGATPAAATDGRTLAATPYRYQYDNVNEPGATCGLTSAAMVLGSFGFTVSPDQLYARFGLAQGQSPGGLAEVYRSYGLHAASSYAGTFDDLRRHIDAGRPVVVHGDFTASGHIVVVIGYDRDGFIVHDPSGLWSGALRGGYPARTATNGRAVRYSLAALDRVIGPSGNIWLSVASRTPL
jgi:hypothetical protein